MARCLRRAGQVYDARQLLRRAFAAGRFDLGGLELFTELGRQAGFLSAERPRRSSLLNVSGLLRGGGRSDLEVEIGYAGIEGAGALQSVLALADAFACPVYNMADQPVEPKRRGSGRRRSGALTAFESPQETSYDLRLELPRPLEITPRLRLRAVRVATVPTAPGRERLRQRILRRISGLVFVPDTRSEGVGETNEAAFRRLARDFSEIWGAPLEDFRLALQYLEPTPPSLRRAFQLSLGIHSCPQARAHIEASGRTTDRSAPLFASFRVDADKIEAHEGVLDSFCLLLLGIARDLERLQCAGS